MTETQPRAAKALRDLSNINSNKSKASKKVGGRSLDDVLQGNTNADIEALMKKAMANTHTLHTKTKALQVYEDDKENSGAVGLQQKKRNSGGQSRRKPARYGDWFDGDDAELEKMVDEFNDEQVDLKTGVEAHDVARQVREITDGLCSQLDSLIDEDELSGPVDEQSLRDKLLESWEGKTYYDRLLQMAGSNETTSTLIQKSLQSQGRKPSVSPSHSSDSCNALLSPPKPRGNGKYKALNVQIPEQPLIPEEALAAVDKNPLASRKGPGLLKVSSSRGSKPILSPRDDSNSTLANASAHARTLKKQLAQQQEALAGTSKSAQHGLARLQVMKKEPTMLHQASQVEREFRSMDVEVQKLLTAAKQLANQIAIGKANASVLVKSLSRQSDR